MKRIQMNKLTALLLLAFLVASPFAQAQEAPNAPAVAPVPAVAAPDPTNATDASAPPSASDASQPKAVTGPTSPEDPMASDAAPAVADIHRAFQGSLFYTPQEVAMIQQVMMGAPVIGGTVMSGGVAIQTRRFIRLSGVLWRGAKDWIVWVNGYKVTPKYMLPEIVSMNVKSSSRVNFKWYDLGLDEVLDVTLRPHQVYDITSAILLPGSE